MIHPSTLSAAYPLAQTLAERGLRLTPLAQTPLESLVKVGQYPNPTRGGDNASTPSELILRGSLLKDQFGICQHDVVMDEVVEVVAASVRRNLDLAKDTINPIVKQVLADVEAHTAAANSTTPTAIEIFPVNYHPIWNSPVLTEMVARYQEIEHHPVALTEIVPYPTDRNSLLELAKTGASRFDQEITELFGTIDDDMLSGIYNAVWGSEGSRRASNLGDLLGAGDITVLQMLHYGQATSILVHLWSRKLLQEPPEGVNKSIDEYRSYMADIVSQSGRNITAILKRRENAIQAKQLVGSWPSGLSQLGLKPITILVNGDVYSRWLEEGGEPDVILGSFITTQERGYTALLEGKETYARDWARQYRILSTTQRLEAVNTFTDGLRQSMARQINGIDPSVVVVSREQLHKQLELVLGRLGAKAQTRLYENVRRVVCETLFPHTLGLQILKAIDAVSEQYPDIDVREAAFLATIEVVALWVAKLCKVDYFTPVGV